MGGQSIPGQALAGDVSGPGLGDGITVSDAAGNVRVTVGKIASNPDDYGLKVTSSDGSTVIIDGSSDMFKIAATGTLSRSWPAGTGHLGTSVTLTALGSYTTQPVIVSTVAWDNSSADNDRWPSSYLAWLEGTGVYGQAFVYGNLVAGLLKVLFTAAQQGVTFNGLTATMRYYVLGETAI